MPLRTRYSLSTTESSFSHAPKYTWETCFTGPSSAKPSWRNCPFPGCLGLLTMHLCYQCHKAWEGKASGSQGTRCTLHCLVLTGWLRETGVLGSSPAPVCGLHLTLGNALICLFPYLPLGGNGTHLPAQRMIHITISLKKWDRRLFTASSGRKSYGHQSVGSQHTHSLLFTLQTLLLESAQCWSFLWKPQQGFLSLEHGWSISRSDRKRCSLQRLQFLLHLNQ